MSDCGTVVFLGVVRSVESWFEAHNSMASCGSTSSPPSTSLLKLSFSCSDLLHSPCSALPQTFYVKPIS